MEGMWVEAVGLIGTGFIVLCFTFDDQEKIRVFDTVGAVLFIVYGLLIGALSNVVLNGILVAINCYKVAKIRKEKRDGENRQTPGGDRPGTV